MTNYKIKIEPEAHQDIQEAIDWYNQQQPGLGRRFHTEVKASFKKLEIHPFFQIRYDNVYCFLLNGIRFIYHQYRVNYSVAFYQEEKQRLKGSIVDISPTYFTTDLSLGLADF